MATPLSKYSGQVRDLTQASIIFFNLSLGQAPKQSSRLSARGEMNDVGCGKN